MCELLLGQSLCEHPKQQKDFGYTLSAFGDNNWCVIETRQVKSMWWYSLNIGIFTSNETVTRVEPCEYRVNLQRFEYCLCFYYQGLMWYVTQLFIAFLHISTCLRFGLSWNKFPWQRNCLWHASRSINLISDVRKQRQSLKWHMGVNALQETNTELLFLFLVPILNI
jgi:hypothetical protein